MTPAEFAARWGTPLMRYPPELLEGCSLKPVTRAFLTEAGVPRDEPRFGFYDPERFLYTPHFQDFDAENPDLAHLRDLLHIADDAGGNPVCIDRKQGDAIVLLDHEWEYKPTFVNSSLVQFFAFLLHDRESVGAEESNREILEEIDKPALSPDTYWFWRWNYEHNKP